MKKVNLLAIVAAISLVFSSCSNEDSSPLDTSQKSLLKKYKIERNATGAYSVDFDTEENTAINKFVDATTNSSEFLLSESINSVTKDATQDLLIDNNQLKISVVDGNTNKKSSITVFDDNISLQRKSNDSKLASYSIEANEEGTYTLDFQVNVNVDVSFVYNESISTYEIHLEDGSGEQSDFSRTLEKESDIPLKIDFVNHNTNTAAKSFELAMIRKPKVIIDNGDD